jgi:hypothetical protein
VFALLVIAIAPAASAIDPAVDIGSATTTVASGGSDAVRGYSFDLVESVRVTHLGWFDRLQDGLTNAHEVGLWDGSGALVVSATVPAGTAAPLVDGFRYVAISPVVLDAGETYVVAGTDPAPTADPFRFQGSGVAYDPAIGFVQSLWVSSSSLTLPVNSNPSNDEGYFGPNLALDRELPAVDLETATVSIASGGSDGVRGFSFEVTIPVSVTRLGWFDRLQDGFNNAHEIGIFEGSGALVTSATVPAGTTAPLEHDFRWVAIAPVQLAPGQTYVIAGTDPAPTADPFRFQASGVSYDARVGFLESRWISSSTLTLPVNNNPSDDDGYFGPNFTIEAVDIPALSLAGRVTLGMLLGLVALAGLRRRPSA